ETAAGGGIVYVNARWCEIAGLDAAAALGDGWHQAIHPDDRQAAVEEWAAAVGEGRESARELRMVTPGGAVRWVSTRTKPLVSARALLALLNDILDLSKIESGRLELETIPFSLRDTLTEALRTLAVRAHQKGLELACDVSPEVPDATTGDPARLRQLVLNVVG